MDSKRKIEETELHSDRRLGLNLYLLVTAGLIVLLAFGVLAGCDVERRKSDAELGLTPQQAAGRKIYDNYCDRCHLPYSTKGKKGPGLKGVFQNKFLPQTGLPANDERVTDMIRNGRPDMPGYSQVLTSQNIQDLLAYMHTL
jgi:mono/diheme cytochrome c family protein